MLNQINIPILALAVGVLLIGLPLGWWLLLLYRKLYRKIAPAPDDSNPHVNQPLDIWDDLKDDRVRVVIKHQQ